jgi:hypothetical protein
MWCWRRMQKIGWSDGVRNEIVFTYRVNEEGNNIQTVK